MIEPERIPLVSEAETSLEDTPLRVWFRESLVQFLAAKGGEGTLKEFVPTLYKDGAMPEEEWRELQEEVKFMWFMLLIDRPAVEDESRLGLRLRDITPEEMEALAAIEVGPRPIPDRPLGRSGREAYEEEPVEASRRRSSATTVRELDVMLGAANLRGGGPRIPRQKRKGKKVRSRGHGSQRDFGDYDQY